VTTPSGMARVADRSLPKCPTGIQGLDEITEGGLPAGRPTLICGGAGCGKTLLAAEFIVRGVLEFNEPGVFMAFEETAHELTQNLRSLGFDLDELVAQNQILVDEVRVERNEIEETGEYDLEGLFIRLGHAIDSIGAKRVVLDTIETLFSGFSNVAILRAELRRLFRWLKDKGVTAVITGERGEQAFTRQGLEEYVSDCVILLDHRVNEQISTRRLRIVKYRGTTHGTNEFPFTIDESGFSVLPITSLGLQHKVLNERVSTGIPKLDQMLGGVGIFRGSSVLISGTSGSGKSSVAAHFAEASCRRGERCLYFAFEESQSQIIRNMRSIGLDLQPWIDEGLLAVHATRPTFSGLEMHLVAMHKRVQEFKPSLVVVDPISNLLSVGSSGQTGQMLVRLIDFLKSASITAVFTNLTSGGNVEATDIGVSSIIDTWLLLRDLEANGERNRALYALKSRGTAHSNQVREFVLTDNGIQLLDVYVGPEGVLTGSSRLAQEAKEKAAMLNREQNIQRQQRELDRKRAVVEAQIAALRMEFEEQEKEMELLIVQDQAREQVLEQDRQSMSSNRSGDSDRGDSNPKAKQKGYSQ
jgi:circadian clock protein KaiC